MSGTRQRPRNGAPRAADVREYHGIEPIELPAPADTELEHPRELDRYLARVAEMLRASIAARLVGIYLVDPVTARLSLRVWADAGQPGSQGGARGGEHAGRDLAPSDLLRRGIDGDALAAATLRDYMHAAPRGERIATPIHDGSSWTGTIVAIADRPLADAAPTVVHDVAAQLAAVLARASMPIGDAIIEESETALELPSDAIFGHSAGGGIAAGPALQVRANPDGAVTAPKVEEDRAQAIDRLNAAIDKTRTEIESILTDAGNELYDVVSLIFSTHIMMLTDDAFSGAIRGLVEAGQTPEDAVQSVVASFVRTFRGLHEARLAEKAQDVRDIGQRLLDNLSPEAPLHEEVAGHVAVLPDALPSDLVRLAIGHASGVVIHGSTVTAHIAILAQSLGLPILMTADRKALEIASRTPLLLDADEGKLLISPTAEQLLDHGIGEAPASTAGRVFAGEAMDHEAAAADEADEERTARVYANVNLLSDARRAFAANAEGIGLYRSEFPFIIRNDYISEEEQFRVYRTIVRSMPDRPVTLRTADIGGDKLLAGREEERNPFLGVRGIRFSLANRELFRAQLRAMLRAGAGADLRIMFPMVSTVEEIEDAREEIERCIDALERSGIEHHAVPQIGAMVELPSAVVAIEEFAERTDFLSIGTNDLIMYLLAVDRTNERLAELYRSHHPVVLRTIAEIARRVGDRIDRLSVCGESAADPCMIPFYLGIGIRRLSVSPRHIRAVRDTIGRHDASSIESFATEILDIRTLKEMDRFLTEYAQPERRRA